MLSGELVPDRGDAIVGGHSLRNDLLAAQQQVGVCAQFDVLFESLTTLEHVLFFTRLRGVVPKEYIPAVDRGVRDQMENGVVAGYPVVDVKVTLYDGSYHDVDSSEMAFKIAGSMGFREGAAKADPVLLEPIMKVEVVTPEDYMGDVMGDLNRRRGLPQGMDDTPAGKVIRAEVPLAEMFGYATDLRSMSQGRATYSMEFLKYHEVPNSVADSVIKKAS